MDRNLYTVILARRRTAPDVPKSEIALAAAWHFGKKVN
jgi:hypothetical protein